MAVLEKDYKVGDKITFKENDTVFSGIIIEMLSKEEANECKMWSRPFKIQKEDNSISEIMEYEIMS